MTPDVNDSGNRYSFSYSCDDIDQPVVGIVQAVAWVTDSDPCALEPLYSVIEVESLRNLICPASTDFYRDSSGEAPEAIEVRFEYEGCVVTVTPRSIDVERV